MANAVGGEGGFAWYICYSAGSLLGGGDSYKSRRFLRNVGSIDRWMVGCVLSRGSNRIDGKSY